MPVLADLQKTMRDAVVLGASGLESLLVGGTDPRARLAIHQRQYRASLTSALVERFPATVWLAGSSLVMEAASEFVRTRPPSRPCIAEYGDEFPEFVAQRPGASAIPYLKQFAELEWHLGRLALAIDRPALGIRDLATLTTAALSDAKVVIQPGVHYLQADWAIDELISLYLSDRAPERFWLQHSDVWLEIRGVRGRLHWTRLAGADFTFRAALAAGESLPDAALLALQTDAAFDPGQALLDVLGEGLVVAIHSEHLERGGV